MKRQAIKPVRQACAAQQRNFDAFRREYNDERPHEALGQTTPASHVTVSPRPYPSRLPQPTYPGHFLVKRITTAGPSERLCKRSFLNAVFLADCFESLAVSTPIEIAHFC